MSTSRVSSRAGKGKPARTTYQVKPVTLPTFAFYGFAHVSYLDGVMSIGAQPGRPQLNARTGGLIHG